MALALAACGGDDAGVAGSSPSSAPTSVAEPAPTAGETAGTQAAEADPLETVRLANFGHFVPTVMWDNAILDGYFEANGVALEEPAPIFNASQIVQSLEQGDADMAFTGGSGVVSAAAVGRDVRIVANVVVGLPLKVVLTTDALGELAGAGITPESPIEDKVAGLKGMTIVGAAAGSTQDTAFRYALKQYGLDPDSDLTIQPLGDSASIVAAVREGRVDGMFTLAGGADVQAAMEGWGDVLLNFAEGEGVLTDFPQFVLAATTSYIEEHPDAVRGVIAAFAQSWADVKAGLTPEQLAAIKAAYQPDMDPVLFEAAMAAFVPGLERGSPVPTEAEFDALIAVNDSAADAPAELTFDELYDVSIVESLE